MKQIEISFYVQLLLLITLLSLIAGCKQMNQSGSSNLESSGEDPCLEGSSGINWLTLEEQNCDYLSSYGLFSVLSDSEAIANSPGFYYQPVSQLFSDYAIKKRFLFIPPGQVMKYQSRHGFDMPEGTVIAKIFMLPKITGSQIVEVRLLIHRPSGWFPLVYVPAENGEFQRTLIGGTLRESIVLEGSETEIQYLIPDQNQCKNCHGQQEEGKEDSIALLKPISIKARHLNWSLPDTAENQLEQWQANQLLEGLPDHSEREAMPNWQDPTAPIEDRAKSYLDINCSHCHSDTGGGALSGLRLEYWRSVGYQHGVCNEVHGWNGGPLGLTYDIVPGQPNESALIYRMNVEGDAKAMMPPLGRSVKHSHAVEVVTEWIETLNMGFECGQ